MTRRALYLAPISAVALFTLLSPSASAQGPAPRVPHRQGQAVQRPLPPAVGTPSDAPDAGETRGQLRETLNRYGPGLAGVLKLDPTLLTNADYLAPYPALAEFLAQHPEVARDPRFFFEGVSIPGSGEPAPPMNQRQEVVALWRHFLEGSMMFLVFVVVTSTLVWLIKTLIDYRRWSRLSKVQAEVHNKVVDRFANNEELLAYVQTSAGRRFLESAPIALDPAAGAMSAPIRRILWAVEAGFVLMAGGIGLQYVSRHVPPDVSPVPLALGVLGVALGIGFVVAAIVSFAISRYLGLLTGTTAPEKGLSS